MHRTEKNELEESDIKQKNLKNKTKEFKGEQLITSGYQEIVQVRPKDE